MTVYCARLGRASWLGASLALAGAINACASAPAQPASAQRPNAAPQPPPVATSDRKMAWIMRLEQGRVFRETGVARPVAPPAGPARTLALAMTADLDALSLDLDGSVRRRAVVALGRIGGPDAVPSLISALADIEEEVRASAALSLGQVGLAEGVAPLVAALKDPSVRVRARAIEGLGLTGPTLAASAAPAIATASAGCRDKLARLESDDEQYPKAPDVEACRLALFALVRLRAYDALAEIALDAEGKPASHWWPVAYALQRINDKRAGPALLALASTPGVTTAGFALRGLASLGDAQAAPIAFGLATRAGVDVRLRVVAARTLGQVGGVEAVDPLVKLIDDPATPRNLAIEAVAALGATKATQAFDALLDHLNDPWPAMRAAVRAAAAKSNPDGFLLVVSSMPADKDWSVRAALASILATLPADRVRNAIEDLVDDPDARVRGPALEALAVVGAPDLTKRLFDGLDAPDFAVRAVAAKLMGDAQVEGGASRLASAYTRGTSDAAGAARRAAIESIAKYGGDTARATLHAALGDADWPVRRRAAELLRAMGELDARPLMPAPTRQPVEFFESPKVLHPPYSPHAFIETRYGTIEIELNVIDSPVTTTEFIALARSGFFNGEKVHRLVPNFVIQAGDPRGDGEGGPGYSMRDELSTLPFLRGTVGIALSGPDTGGSQFFITVSPQPHLDGRYTVFGRVVKGESVLDLVSQWDVIERVRIWDGVTLR